MLGSQDGSDAAVLCQMSAPSGCWMKPMAKAHAFDEMQHGDDEGYLVEYEYHRRPRPGLQAKFGSVYLGLNEVRTSEHPGYLLR